MASNPTCLSHALDEINDGKALVVVLLKLFEDPEQLGEFLITSAILERLTAAKAELSKIQEGAE